MRTPQINLTLDVETLQASKRLPGDVSASRLMRHLIKAWMYDDKQWLKYRQTDEGKRVIEFMKPLRDRLEGK